MKYLVLPLLLLALSACEPDATAGVVIKKGHDPESYWTQQICSGYNSNGTCMFWTPITHHDDECWRVEFKDDQGRKGSACVDRGVWNQTAVGEHYPRPM